jgi:hypothetical protein
MTMDALELLGQLGHVERADEAVLDASLEQFAQAVGLAALYHPSDPARRLPPGREADLRSRRRLAPRLAYGVAAALAAGVAVLVAVGVPGEGHDGMAGPVVSTAYVVKRVHSALSAAGPVAIAQLTVTTRGPGGTTTGEEWSYGDQSRLVTNSAAGHPAYDQGFSSGSVYTLVSYLMRAWARHRRPDAPVLGPRGCEPGLAVVPLPRQAGLGYASLLPATVVSDLRAAISCGTLALAGRQRVDGIDAIELTSRRGSPIPDEIIWVSPRTYLPVRVVARSYLGGSTFQQAADIVWLKPTVQNLAKLTVPVPAGFRQAPVAQIVRQMRTRSW